MKEDFLNDSKYREQQLILEEEMSYKELDINTNDSSLAFLWYLVTIKRFDADAILRVIEKPHHNTEMYNQFLKERKKEWDQ